AIILVDQRVYFRMTTDELNARINATQEILAKAGTPTLIPRIRLEEIPFNFGREAQFSGHIDCEFFVVFPARKAPNSDCSGDSVFYVSVLLFANRVPAHLQALMQCHPRGLPPTGASPTGSTQR